MQRYLFQSENLFVKNTFDAFPFATESIADNIICRKNGLVDAYGWAASGLNAHWHKKGYMMPELPFIWGNAVFMTACVVEDTVIFPNNVGDRYKRLLKVEVFHRIFTVNFLAQLDKNTNLSSQMQVPENISEWMSEEAKVIANAIDSNEMIIAANNSFRILSGHPKADNGYEYELPDAD